jgi:tRNA G10  N-methylase Trm11
VIVEDPEKEEEKEEKEKEDYHGDGNTDNPLTITLKVFRKVKKRLKAIVVQEVKLIGRTIFVQNREKLKYLDPSERPRVRFQRI